MSIAVRSPLLVVLAIAVPGCVAPDDEAVDGLLLALDEPAPAADAALYQRPLTAANIRALFRVRLGQPVTRAEMVRFFTSRARINPFDARLAAVPFLDWDSGGFIPDPQRQQDLVAEGLTRFRVANGLTAREYLTYLRVAHGEGRCPGVAAGSPGCPARVRDMQLHLIVLQNLLWNIRSTATDDDPPGRKYQYENKFTIHRESYANRLTFDLAGRALGQGADPLRAVSLADRCDLLEAIFANGDALWRYLVDEVGVHPDVATVMRNQYVGVVEPYQGQTYRYGLMPFLQGQVCSRYPDKQGQCYAPDPAIHERLIALHPGFSPRDGLSCQQIKDMINVTCSFPPPGDDPPLDPPYDDLSPEVTGDELVDFVIAMGNALTNVPGALFADIIPQADLDLLDASGVYNPENQLTSKTINHFYQLLLSP
jgi:hypothetical protein